MSSRRNRRFLSLAIALVVLASGCATDNGPGRAAGRGSPARSGPASLGEPVEAAGQEPSVRASEAARRGGRTARAAGSSASGQAAGPASGRGAALGVTDDAIKVVYYWRGDRTRTSPFLRNTAAEGNLDEGKAFRTLVEWVNRNGGGNSSLMGFRFNLHGRRLRAEVVEANSSPEQNVSAAQQIASEMKPFAALAAHGSVSTYACPHLAAAGVYNLSTYSMDFGLAERSNGFCLPHAASFEDQVTALERYLSGRVARQPYDGQQRRFGIVHAEYPGLADAVRTVAERFRRAGVDVVSVQSVSADAAQAQQQAPNVVAQLKSDRVNTVIFPDAGTPLSLLPAAEAYQFRPDYTIWPCSGQDAPAMVRLYNADQWSRASGLTCYDRDLMPDIATDDSDRRTEWYRAFRSVDAGTDPPPQTAYIYAGLLPLLAGITNAGRALDHDTFRAGLARFEPYRYSTVQGRTPDDRSLLLSLNAQDRPLIGDFTVLRWSNTARRSGSPLAGTYVFPEEGRRYPPRHDWR